MVKEMAIEKQTLTCRCGIGTAREETMPRPKRRRAVARNNEARRGAGGKNNGPQPRKKPPVSTSLNLSALSLTYKKDDRTKTTTSCSSQ
ncbi:hypothetical protein M9H77_32337 [Catharanthus roseus]|uniref:Uncharacterized protein n=1 Tax=Catharanthus roseus TaxID=4058 RepID=A0ACC0A2K8_CATRO|nr:hypothetical protein M9H77_32337 [Catharanthus roseus]